jgi:hypothetical protein
VGGKGGAKGQTQGIADPAETHLAKDRGKGVPGPARTPGEQNCKTLKNWKTLAAQNQKLSRREP